MGATIRALRAQAGVSQHALGVRAAMHRNYVGAIERGAIPNPGLATIDRLASGLDVSIAVLAESYAAALSWPGLGVDATGPRSHAATQTWNAQALGEAIRVVRRQLGLTQTQLADAIGLQRTYLASVEAGEKSNPGIATIARIARAMAAKLGSDEPPLLSLLAQTFTGERTAADVRATVDPKPSGPSDALWSPT